MPISRTRGSPYDVQAPVGGRVEELQAVEETAARAAPVLGSFVASAVPGVAGEEAVQGSQDAPYRRIPPRGVGIGQQLGREPARADPGRPVPQLSAAETEPAEVVALTAGREDPLLDLAFDALAHTRRDFVELLAEDEEHPGQLRGCLCGEQIHHVPSAIREVRGFRLADVGRQAPGRLLADEPESVGRRIQEAALPFHALGHGQGAEHAPAPEVQLLETVAVAVAEEVQVAAGGQNGPGGGQRLLSLLDVGLTDFPGKSLPRPAVRACRIWLPGVAGGYASSRGEVPLAQHPCPPREWRSFTVARLLPASPVRRRPRVRLPGSTVPPWAAPRRHRDRIHRRRDDGRDDGDGTTAYRHPLQRDRGLTTPSFARRNTTSGSSKHRPIHRSRVVTKET